MLGKRKGTFEGLMCACSPVGQTLNLLCCHVEKPVGPAQHVLTLLQIARSGFRKLEKVLVTEFMSECTCLGKNKEPNSVSESFCTEKS